MQKIRNPVFDHRIGFFIGKPQKIVAWLLGCLTLLFLPADGLPMRTPADPSHLPLLQIDDFRYMGAFRLPDDSFGASSLNYPEVCPAPPWNV